LPALLPFTGGGYGGGELARAIGARRAFVLSGYHGARAGR
jgi:hypothetical protein